MALIKKITPSSRNNDTSGLLTLILKAFAKNDWSTDTYLTPILVRTNILNTGMIEALRRLTAYSQMAEKDHDRDMTIRDLFQLVEGYTHIPITEIQDAALIVYYVLDKYGLSLQNENYVAESGDIESLLHDLAMPDIVAAIAKLQGVAETISTLATNQQDFENVTLEQAEDEGEDVKNDLATASKLKKEAIVEINTGLVGYLNTMAKVNPTTYADIAHTIAELIDTNNELVKRRRNTNEPDTTAV